MQEWLYQQIPVVVLAIICLIAVWTAYLKQQITHKEERDADQKLFQKERDDHKTELKEIRNLMADSDIANLDTMKDIVSCMNSVTDGQDKTQVDVLAIKDLVLEKIDDLKSMIINGKSKE